MPATDSELTSVEDPRAKEDDEGSLTNNPSSSQTAVSSSTPLVPTTARPNFTNETVFETKAVSMASNDCSSALSSPAEASPAKAAVTSPATVNGTVETNSTTSPMASASDSQKCAGMSLVNISALLPLAPLLPSTPFGGPVQETDFPAVLTFKGVTVSLESNSVWKQFYSCGTEMILTKQGRRMFPYCRYRLSGLDPERQYSLVLSLVPSDQYKYRWNVSKWEVNGLAEHQTQGLIRAFSHHYSPCRGSEWMSSLVSFYKLKLTNNSQDQEGHIILHSMHRYIPRLHVIPCPDGIAPTPDQPLVMGPESMTFTFPQTEFMAVTTYQNFRITQLKINHNPFAKGFREDGNNPRLNRVSTVAQPVIKIETPPCAVKPAESDETKPEVVDLSTKAHAVSAPPSSEQERRLVLKPIMSSNASKDEPYVPCLRGKHALGELVLVQKRPCVEPKEETHAVAVTPKMHQSFSGTPKAISKTPTSLSSTLGLSPAYRKKRKRINRHWGNSRGREWKAATASPTVIHSPSLTVAMQPELDDVEGLLFVSFTSKEALEVHVRDMPASDSTSASPVSLTAPMQLRQTVEVTTETDEERIILLEALLLRDLQVLKHRQVIHPVLQEVGLKLSSLDPNMSIDLLYLGVHLPLPPPNLPDKSNATSPDAGLAFISRTGKTSDVTKIKGWRNKFIRSKETSSSNCDGSQKNLSAFCSNMLDEYLESEGQYISECADAFSTNAENSVAYQLPAKGSSYVKTLDSVLKHRNTAPKLPPGVNKPCPLSHKPLLYSALVSPAPPLASSTSPVHTGAPSKQHSTSSHIEARGGTTAKAASGSNSSNFVSRRLHHPAASQRSGQGTHRPVGVIKFQYKLLQMENGAENDGLPRTQLTTDRLTVALSVMLTKQMQSNQNLKVAEYPSHKAKGPDCGQDFCRLGCVCSSLQHLNRGPLHCRRPECMFGCGCFKRKITKQLTAVESEQQIQPVYSVTNMEHVVQPSLGSHAKILWNRNTHKVDPDPLFAPKSAPLCSVPVKPPVKRSAVFHPMQPIREEDKDPVYKYLESLMTCARVREFNSKPPPEVTIEPKILNTPMPNITEKQQTTKTTADNPPKVYYRTLLNGRKAEQISQGTTSNESEIRKQIEIQSGCQWDKDRKRVLETLCRRMNQNRLSQCFSIGPYRIRPVTKIFMRKPSGSLITYRVHISKPSQASDNEEDEVDDSDEDTEVYKSPDGEVDAEEGVERFEEPEMQYGVTPFMSGVIPAGRLRARTKPVGCQEYGLIQVNGKSYNQARLLLGNMGSLHPANRLAAYVTGRLNAPAGTSLQNSQKSDPTNKINTQSTLHIKAAGTVVPSIITARKTTELKTPTQPPAQPPMLDFLRKDSMSLPQPSTISSTVDPVQKSFLKGSSVSPFQTSSTSLPVSLTVSPSLKTPSFLGQSGTYSFRICPPTNSGTRGKNLPGVTLPGGFTLIQLPKPAADGDAKQSESVSTPDLAAVGKAPPPKDAPSNLGPFAADSDANWLGLDTLTGAKDLLSGKSVVPGSSSKLMYDEAMPSEGSGEAKSRQVDSNLGIVTEDFSSDSSDYCGDGDEDELVDIETVEEVRQGMAIAKMKEAVRKALRESRDSSDDFGSARELRSQDQMDDERKESGNNKRRRNHTELEKQRRFEQRNLFDKLQTALQTDPKTPRLRLLSLALREIQNLVETSKHLEEQKRRLAQMQAVYIKELSLLSGKSDKLIKQKLNEICERQKTREKTTKWRPFFSTLLQSRAAFLQSTAAQSKPQSKPQSTPQFTPLLRPEFFKTLCQTHPNTSTVQNSVNQTLMPAPQSLSASVSSPAQAEVAVPSPQAENQTGEPAGPAKVIMSSSLTECQPQVPSSQVAATSQVTAAQDEVSLTAPAPITNASTVPPSQTVSLPLIRSKTGRIILPSSLKPFGQGFYTLVLMDAKKREENEKVNTQASNAKSECLSESESSHILKDNKTAQSSHSQPKRSPALQNVLQVAEKSQKGGAVVSLNKTPATARLSFSAVPQGPASAEPQSDSSPPVARRGRGRPPKKPKTPVSENSKQTSVKDTSTIMTERKTSAPAEVSPAVVGDDPVPVKRRRGRPPKKKQEQMLSHPVKSAGSSPSVSNEDSPVRLSLSFTSPAKPKESPTTTTSLGDRSTSRPLTRGALGKDFPSAKKRSWIDVEKELEPELEFE